MNIFKTTALFFVIIFSITFLNACQTQKTITETEDETTSFTTCFQPFWEENAEKYENWKSQYETMNPGQRVLDANYCELNDGNKLISYSYLLEDDETGERVIALYDQNDQVIRSTEGFTCNTIGEIAAPRFEEINDGKVTLVCGGADALLTLKETYELDLETFKYALVDTETETGEEE